MGLEQAGLEVKQVAWIFLKYVEIRFMGKKTVKSKEKTEISKVVERCKIGSEMAKYVEQVMIEQGFDEVDIEIALNEFKAINSFSILPESVRTEFKMLPYVCKYEVTDEVKKECEEYIDNTIEKWESLGDDEENYPPLQFTKTKKNGGTTLDLFYCQRLCGHSKTCKYLHDFIDKWDTLQSNKDEYSDLF